MGRLIGLAAAAIATFVGTDGTQDAVANGDTRSITILHEHTKESATITFRRNGSYDQAALKELNWLLRDWRLDESTRMEPRLFDIVWEVYREVGSQEPIRIVSAYRSPQTNGMLRRRSRAVAEHSQHMAGKAMDFYLPDVPMARVREIGMRLQSGGVGFYPNSYNPFVHLDVGSVRSWPRMTGDQLARLFPDGRTVHLPRDGKPLAGYEVAKAEILARGGSVAGLAYADSGEGGGERKSLWATLFGGGDDEDSDFYRSSASRTRAAAAPARSRVAYADVRAGGNSEDGGMRDYAPAPALEPAQPLRGSRRVAPPETAPAEPVEPAPVAAPTAVAALETGPSTTAFVPAPPRRPDELAVLFAAAPLPPARPVAGFAGESFGQMRTIGRIQGVAVAAATDERAALRSLFEAAATPSIKTRMQFSSATRDDIGADKFRGPAVAPLHLIR